MTRAGVPPPRGGTPGARDAVVQQLTDANADAASEQPRRGCRWLPGGAAPPPHSGGRPSPPPAPPPTRVEAVALRSSCGERTHAWTCQFFSILSLPQGPAFNYGRRTGHPEDRSLNCCTGRRGAFLPAHHLSLWSLLRPSVTCVRGRVSGLHPPAAVPTSQRCPRLESDGQGLSFPGGSVSRTAA